MNPTKTLNSIIKTVNRGFLDIDNFVFKLHYIVTFTLMMICSTVVTFKNVVGDPIDCIFNNGSKTMDMYCYTHATFSITGNGYVRDYRYYQWVHFMLFFQALSFYVPCYLWEFWEGHRIASLAAIINNKDYDEEDKNYVLKCIYFNFNRMNFYLYRFAFCEFLNLVNVILQLYLTDVFLGGEFSGYGWKVFTFMYTNSQIRTDPMARVFPITSKCTFYQYGLTGSIENRDGLCVLPLNVLNEKIYIAQWVWFLILTVASCFAVAWRILSLVYPERSSFALRASSGAAQNVLKIVDFKCNLGDRFFLQTLGKNISPVEFRDILVHLAENNAFKVLKTD